MLRIIKQTLGECNLRKLICMILVVSSYGCFTYFSIDAILEFQKEKTGYHQFSTLVTELELPVITICPKESYKNMNSQTTKHDILKNLSYHTYTWTDFFHSKFLEELIDWDYHEIFNIRLGICFSLKPKQNVTRADSYTVLPLMKNISYQVNIYYLHK